MTTCGLALVAGVIAGVVMVGVAAQRGRVAAPDPRLPPPGEHVAATSPATATSLRSVPTAATPSKAAASSEQDAAKAAKRKDPKAPKASTGDEPAKPKAKKQL